MERITQSFDAPSEADLQLADLQARYGERETAVLVAFFADKHTDLTREEIIGMIHTCDHEHTHSEVPERKEGPLSEDETDEYLQSVIEFKCL